MFGSWDDDVERMKYRNTYAVSSSLSIMFLSYLHSSCLSFQASLVQPMLSFIGFYCAVKPGLKYNNLIDTYNYEYLLNSQTY